MVAATTRATESRTDGSIAASAGAIVATLCGLSVPEAVAWIRTYIIAPAPTPITAARRASTVIRTFLDESQDAITFGPTPVHTHSPSFPVSLGAAPPPACPRVNKYAYRTDATPVGTESPANPIAFAFRASDTGVGLDETASTFAVTSPTGQAFGPYPLISSPAVGLPGAFDAIATLLRNGPTAVAPLGEPGGQQEGLYYVTFSARDRLGQSSTLTRCFDYAPLGPPLQLIQNAGPFARSSRNVPITALIDSYTLHPGSILDLINGVALGGIMELRLQNTTNDPAFLTFAPQPAASPRYTKRITTHLHPTTTQAVTSPRYDPATGEPNTGQNALCYGVAGTIRPDVVVSTPTAIATWIPSVALYDVSATNIVTGLSAPCPGCGTLEWQIPPGEKRAVIVGLASVPELRPDLAGPYDAIDQRSGVLDAASGVATECVSWTNGGTPTNPYRQCATVQRYDQWRVVWQAGITTGALSVDWSSAASATLTARSNWMSVAPSQRAIPSFAWSTVACAPIGLKQNAPQFRSRRRLTLLT